MMGSKYRTVNRKKIAQERIAELFKKAEEFFTEDPSLSNRCVKRARIIAMRYRVRIPREMRMQYCRRCYSFLVPGVNMRVRIQRGKVIVTCTECGYQRRYQVVE
jgi:ribonuclease P protein subunit RPR2